MTVQSLYPSLKRRPPALKAGWHSAEFYGISEYKWPDGKEPCLKLEFKASNGIIHLLLPMKKEGIFVLNHIAGMIGIKTKKYRLSALIGETLLVQVKYNRVIKIKTR
jgi:hypothetical protein